MFFQILFGMIVIGAVALGIIGGLLGLLSVWPRLKALERRVQEWEHRPAAAPARDEARKATQPAAPPPAAAVSAISSPTPAPPRPPVGPTSAPVPARAPAPPLPAAQTPPAASPEPTPPPTSEAAPAPVAAPTWEMEVGSNWLNKIGVLIVVIGLALGVSYSFTQLGPAGRVAVACAVSFAMLGAGIGFARREQYRTYAHGLVAGGWAGLYFTTYAMHGVEAARVIDSEWLATSLLVAVAAGMVGHSLRYRSQTVTVLAFVVAYATLSMTPLTMFALVAAIPLAASVLAVGQRFGWAGVSALGIAATYGLIALRGIGAAGTLERESFTPAVILAAYWATFELADILGLAARRVADAVARPLGALNAVGFTGALVIVAPIGDAASLSTYLAVVGGAYLASALARRRIIGAQEPLTGTGPTTFTSFHVAMAMSAVLILWSTGTRFDGPRLTLGWLLEPELVFAAGLVLRDPVLRRLGSLLLVLPGLRAVLAGSTTEWFGLPDTTVVMIIVAATFYVNREWMRSRGETPRELEGAYAWAGTGLAALALALEVSTFRLGLSLMLAAAVLVEIGLRRAREYRLQGYTLGLIATWSLLVVFGGGAEPPPAQLWTGLLPSVVLAWAIAVRLSSPAGGSDRDELDTASLGMWWVGAALVGVFEWRLVDPPWLAPLVAATGAGMAWSGLVPRLRDAQWPGFVLLVVGAVASMEPVLQPDPSFDTGTAGALIAVALLYGVSVAGRLTRGPGRSDTDRTVEGFLFVTGSMMLATIEWRVLPDAWAGPIKGLTGVAFLGLGLAAAERGLRLQGQAFLLASAVRTAGPIFAPGAASGPVLAAALVVVAMLYGASLAVKRWSDGALTDGEHAMRLAMSIGATAFVAALVPEEMRESLVTLTWGLIGLALLVLGFPARERVLRLSGLALLTLCVLKLFVYDLSQLEALPRILSFVVLGLVLLAVSWGYTRMKGDGGRVPADRPPSP